MFRGINNELYLNWQDVQIAEELDLPLDHLQTRREGLIAGFPCAAGAENRNRMLVVRFNTPAERDAWHARINAEIWGTNEAAPK